MIMQTRLNMIFFIYFFRLPRQREVLPREEVVCMLKISVSIKVTAGAVALLLTVLLRSCS